MKPSPLAARAVSVSYGRTRVLDQATLEARRGVVLALLGPNGAGKTTLLKVLAGLLGPQAGWVDRPAAGGIAYLAQSEPLPLDWTAREVVTLGRLPHHGPWRNPTQRDHAVIERAMERTNTTQLGERLLATLSGGERQRVALARALAQEPNTLLLDEPASHLDVGHQVELMGMLRAEARAGASVVLIMHDLGLAAYADRCALLSAGRIVVDGVPGNVLRPELLSAVYGTDFEALQSATGQTIVVPVPRRTRPEECEP